MRAQRCSLSQIVIFGQWFMVKNAIDVNITPLYPLIFYRLANIFIVSHTCI